MKTDLLYDVFVSIDEKYVREAENTLSVEKTPIKEFSSNGIKRMKSLAAAVLLICLVFSLALMTGTALNNNHLLNLNDNKSEVEYGSLFFDSVDQLCRTIKEYSLSSGVNNQRLYTVNSFETLTMDYYPKITDPSFSLFTIEVNKYNVFYYYTPSGSDSFSYSNGIVVTVPREEDATMENIKKQFPSATELSDSLFVNEIHSWFIPMGCSYYEISYPSSMQSCDKSIIEMIPIDCANNTQ